MNKTMFLDNQDAERLSASGADLSRLSQIADYPEGDLFFHPRETARK